MRKKFISLVVALVFLWSNLVIPQQTGSGGQIFEGGLGGAETSTTPAYNTLTVFSRSYSRLCLTLWVATRGATDSLSVIVQTNPFFPSSSIDTLNSPWRTLTSFDGAKSATGFTVRCFPTGTPARDSVLEMYQWVRILFRHSVDSAVSTDTSTWKIFRAESGDPIL